MASVMKRTILGNVGFNPFRPQNDTIGDYVLAVVAVIAILGLIAWALLG